ncbi:MAG: SUMF1/EgtB/PvdO family nonheme iron enzyme [Paraclostridium sp.]
MEQIRDLIPTELSFKMINLIKSAKVLSLEKKYIKCTGDKSLTLYANTSFYIVDRVYTVDNDVLITESNLDTGTFTVGCDYYIYLCLHDNDVVVKISLNDLSPAGFDATNSIFIGGFHYGDCPRIDNSLDRINTSGSAYGTGWEDNVYEGILKFSVYTLLHRPKCKLPGMVYCEPINGWVDIYINTTGLLSKYNATPVTGTEGYSGYTFTEQLAKVGKRPLFYSEFICVAKGSPKGRDDSNEYCWTATTNTGRNKTGIIKKAVSIFGLKDCVGNVWEWGSDYVCRPVDSPVGWGWKNLDNIIEGAAYMYHTNGISQLRFGGNWLAGRQSGSRAVILSGYPWYVRSAYGVRGFSDSE